MGGRIIGTIAGSIVGALGIYLAVAFVRYLLPDLQRYMRMRSM